MRHRYGKRCALFVLPIWFALWLSSAHGFAVTVPGGLAATDGNSDNGLPFNLGATPAFGPSMRYQQIYSASQFGAGGVIDQIAFRVNGALGSPGFSPSPSFATSGIDIRIDLGYAATTVSTASPNFASNIGPGLVTVLDTVNLSLSGTGGASVNPFDVIIDVADLFVYNPALGDLLLDIRMRNAPITVQFDAAGFSTQSVTARIWSDFSSVADPTGRVNFNNETNPYGLVTRFELQSVPEPTSLALLSLVLAGLAFSRRRMN